VLKIANGAKNPGLDGGSVVQISKAHYYNCSGNGDGNSSRRWWWCVDWSGLIESWRTVRGSVRLVGTCHFLAVSFIPARAWAGISSISERIRRCLSKVLRNAKPATPL